MKILEMIKVKIRLFFGLCPKCNSDAPEKDNCRICHNFYGRPTKEEKQKWFKNYINMKNIQYTCPKTKNVCDDEMCDSPKNCNISSEIKENKEPSFEEISNQFHQIAKDYKYPFKSDEMKSCKSENETKSENESSH